MKATHAALIGGILGVGLILGVAASNIPADEPTLPPCATEDSDNCYWDADTMGNGLGHDSIVIELPPVPRTPAATPSMAPVTPVEVPTELPLPPVDPGARQGYDEGTLNCGVNAGVAVDQDEHGNWWAYCEPALVG